MASDAKFDFVRVLYLFSPHWHDIRHLLALLDQARSEPLSLGDYELAKPSNHPVDVIVVLLRKIVNCEE